MIIRTARAAEASALAELHLRTALHSYAHIFPPDAPTPTLDETVEFWMDALARSQAFVAEIDGIVCGVALAGADPREPVSGHLSRFYVDPPWQGRGIGTRLCDRCMQALRADGYPDATLWVLERNERVRRWYERLGWEPTGERKPVWALGGIDDVRYRYTL